MTRFTGRPLKPLSSRPSTPAEVEADRAHLGSMIRIWGTSLIVLGLFALFGPGLLEFPPVIDPLWGILAISLGLASLWLKHAALLAGEAVFLGGQGLLLAIGGLQFNQATGDTLILAIGILLAVYALRLWGGVQRARRLPNAPADGFALAGIVGALVGMAISGAAFLVSTEQHSAFVRYGLDLSLLALGLSLGALLLGTDCPGLGKIGLGLSLLALIAFLAILFFNRA
mgnify:FL=1